MSDEILDSEPKSVTLDIHDVVHEVVSPDPADADHADHDLACDYLDGPPELP